ncbi:hypothetical protein EV421DRAFT_1738301 [Armillaria borealis]|uniref:Uncharacterized protein n=1 Tax=Armillaria borealis TaxID=47425 RepID=A0AA39JAP2_9AGAR|nr:hypothetical protein EV421DRAFT_1738301 [Armillaria borealis]
MGLMLVVGNQFGDSRSPLGIPTNASILNAVGACGLQLFNFGQTVSLVFFTDAWKPDSFYDIIKKNSGLGLHYARVARLEPAVRFDSDYCMCMKCNPSALSETGYTFSVTKYRTRKLSKKPRGQGAHYYLGLLVLKVNGRGLGRIGIGVRKLCPSTMESFTLENLMPSSSPILPDNHRHQLLLRPSFSHVDGGKFSAIATTGRQKLDLSEI